MQFAIYGVTEKVLPPMDATTRKLLLCPVLVVDPPTGVAMSSEGLKGGVAPEVYNFLRKISTAPFKMLSFAEAEGALCLQGLLDD